jgi:hypothetical protein
MSLSVGEATAIGLGLGNIAAWAKLIYDARKNGKNGNGRPCPLHSGLEAQIKTGEKQGTDLAEELKNLHAENRQDHQQIFADIKALSISVAGAAAAAATAASVAVDFATTHRKRGKT